MKAYKLMLNTAHSYREVFLPVENEAHFAIGTDSGCNVRYSKLVSVEDFHIALTSSDGKWIVMTQGESYLTCDGVMKMKVLTLTHGMEFELRNAGGVTILHISFLLDFDTRPRDYDRVTSLAGVQELCVGGTEDCAFRIQDPLLGSGLVRLTRSGSGFLLEEQNVHYGVSVNGARISRKKQISDMDFFELAGHSYYLRGNCIYSESRDTMCRIRMQFTDLPKPQTQMDYPQFNRSSRVCYQVPHTKLEVMAPEARREQQKKSLLVSLVPSLVMLVLMVVLRGAMGGGGLFMIYSAASMSIGIIMSIVTYRTDRKNEKETEEKRQKSYQEYIQQKETQIQQLRDEEIRVLRIMNVESGEELARIERFDPALYEKTPTDPDFLTVRLGTGSILSENQVEYKEQEYRRQEDPLQDVPEQISRKYRYLEQAPVVLSLLKDNSVGIVGTNEKLEQMLCSITLDLVSRHYSKNVKLAYLMEDADAPRFAWLRWLPHTQDDDLPLRYFGCSEEGRNVVLERIYKEFTQREHTKESDEEKAPENPTQYVVFVYHSKGLGKHPVSRYFENCAEYGFTFVFLDNYAEQLPLGCTEIIYTEADGQGLVCRTEDGEQKTRFVYPAVTCSQMEQAAKKLAAIQIDEISLEAALTKNITMYEMLNIITAEDLDLATRWSTAQVYRGMAVPIGVRANHTLVQLDIGDKSSAHGPHGLVAGTTGSGKSELLQTYVLSMALQFHPYDVAFLMIDFKGGGMANQFRELPHLLGNITDIDGREIDRSLMSIKAELNRRKEVFAQYGVNHINDYIKLFKAGKTALPLPHLIIVVDEFAELKMEYPDFMKELVSAARIGRTLGVHLILATQKPSGVVDPQIWSNSKFKICLKVQGREDSSEVLHSPLAAEIKEAGRAYFQVGNNEVFELFQSAYSGAEVPDLESLSAKPFSISTVESWGRRERIYSSKQGGSGKERSSQLQALTGYVAQYCKDQGIERLPGICLPPLADRIVLSALKQAPAAGCPVALGRYDDPEQQAQAEVVLTPGIENVYLVGSSQSGKTTLLQTLACALIENYTPDQVNLYMIDCGNMALKVFENSKMVGGVVLQPQEERMENLFKLLHRITDERRARFMEAGVGTYAAYCEAGLRDQPMIVVMLDNASSFKEYYSGLTEELLSLTREGLSVGISYIVATTAVSTFTFKTLANFSRKVALHCNDNGDYANLFGHSRISPRELPGRGLIQIDKKILEFQTAICSDAEREQQRNEDILKRIERRNAAAGSRQARPIPLVPEHLMLGDMMHQQPALFRKPYSLPIGMTYSDISYVNLSLLEAGSLVLTGQATPRIGFECSLLSEMNRTAVIHNIEATVLDDVPRPLRSCEDYGFVRDYTSNGEEGTAFVADFCEKVHQRQEFCATDAQGRMPTEVLAEEPLLLLVIENRQVMQSLSLNKAASKELAELLPLLSQYKAMVLFGNVENATVSFNATELMKALKERRGGILFAPIQASKFYDVPVRSKGREPAPGDGYWFDGGRIERIKLVEDN